MAGSGERHDGEPRPAFTRREVIGGAAGTIGVAAAALTAAAPATAQTTEGCFFALEIPDFFTGVFAHASGLGSETLVDTNGGSETVLKIPGNTKWGDIELKRGVDQDKLELVKWRALVEDGRIDEARKTGSITLHNPAGTAVAHYNFVNAWPSKVHVASTPDDGGVCAWETITLRVERVTRVR